MSKRGKDLLLAIGMKPKGGEDEPDGDEDMEEPGDGEMSAAEDLCRALGIDEVKAADVSKALKTFIANC